MSVDLDNAIHAIAAGLHATPFDVLGEHPADPPRRGSVIRLWLPGADTVEVEDAPGGEWCPAVRVHPLGVFEARMPSVPRSRPYRVRADGHEFFDPYAFPAVHSDAELARVRQVDGRIHQILGARIVEVLGVVGTVFAVWAPGARAVSVVGDFNAWNPVRHPMRIRGPSGVWELFVPGVGGGTLYKYSIRSRVEDRMSIKADPCGRQMQLRPETASVVTPAAGYEWTDTAWIARRRDETAGEAPVSVYEVHLGSWRRAPGARPREGEPGWRTYRELGDELVPYVAALGFTHIELLPITEHPYDASWGYQTVGYFAPTSRHGTPDDLRYFVDRAHAAGLGVLLDWVPAHFPTDAHGLGLFDGTHLYEHADPRKGIHPDWRTYIFNYGRPEVVAFLTSSALYWIEEFHVDGLRLDAVASMLYLDYSREDGEWLPNEYGGRENLEATRFLRSFNETIHAAHPGVLVMAEESTAWPGVTHPISEGGLGFDVKWNMGWMHDTLEVFRADPLFRKGLYEKLTFGITYAFAERFLLPFSHDEVVHLKGSMLRKMPGGVLDKFANLRLLLAYTWAHPGKKLLFMGQELGVWDEWDFEGQLDWALADEPLHAGVSRWVGALNALYREERSLHEQDWDGRGFEWLDCHDAARTTLSFLRWSRDWEEFVAVACNFTPVDLTDYRLPVPAAGRYRILASSNDAAYGGAGGTPEDPIGTRAGELHGREHSLPVRLPPYAAVFLKRVPE